MKTQQELEAALTNLEAERKDIDTQLDQSGHSKDEQVGALLRAQAKNRHEQELLRWILNLS